MGLSSVPATNAGKAAAGRRAGEFVVDLLRRDLTPSKIITKAAIENAIAGCGHAGDGVLNRRFGDNFRGCEVTAKKIDYKLTRTATSGCFSCISRRNAGEPHLVNP